MLKTVRLLPVTILAAALLFGVKISVLWQDAERTWPNSALASEHKAESGAQPAKPRDLAAEQEARDAPPPPPPKVEAKVEPEAEAPVPPKRRDVLSEQDPSLFSSSELELLDRLATRREELERQAREIEIRENLLAATEQRIDGRIAELKRIEATIRELLGQHEEAEEAQIRRLVKVYENMKAKDAARLFNRLDIEILLDVAGRMRETKMAPILANMTAEKANLLTVELATRRRLPGVDDALSKGVEPIEPGATAGTDAPAVAN